MSPGHAAGAAAPRAVKPRPPNQRTAFETARSGSCLDAAVAMTNAGRSRSSRFAASTSSSSTGSLPGWSSAPPTSASGPGRVTMAIVPISQPGRRWRSRSPFDPDDGPDFGAATLTRCSRHERLAGCRVARACRRLSGRKSGRVATWDETDGRVDADQAERAVHGAQRSHAPDVGRARGTRIGACSGDSPEFCRRAAASGPGSLHALHGGRAAGGRGGWRPHGRRLARGHGARRADPAGSRGECHAATA